VLHPLGVSPVPWVKGVLTLYLRGGTGLRCEEIVGLVNNSR